MAASPSNIFAASVLQPVAMPDTARIDARILVPGTYVKGQVLGLTSNLVAANEVKTITVSGAPTGGSFILSFGGYNTAAIAWNANAAAVQAAFEALASVGAGNVVAGGGAFPGTPITLTFQGKLAAREMPNVTLYANSLTGGAAPTVASVNTTPGRTIGGVLKAYNDANADGSETAVALCAMDGVVDTFGFHAFGGGDLGTQMQLTAPVFIRGTFKTKELTGLDAAAVADLGRIVKGDVGSLSNDATWLLIA